MSMKSPAQKAFVMEEGDAFDAATMNDLENRVAKPLQNMILRNSVLST